MTNYADWEDLHFDAAAEAEWDMIHNDRFDGFEDESDWEYHMQFDDREDDGWSERDDWDDDVAHDAYVLSSAGWGTDEDYGFFGADYEPPF